MKYYKEMLQAFPCAAFVSIDDRRKQTIDVICANQEYYDLTGITHDAIEFGDHDIRNLDDIATEDKLRVNREFGEAAKEKRNVAMDAQIRLIDGGYMRCRIHARPLETIGDAVVFVVTFHRYDDKDPEKIIKQHYVEHDALTNIFNMKGFCMQTAEVLATYPERHFTIAVSDIDSFKTINNMFGEEVGDTILKRIAASIKENFTGFFRDNIPGSYGRIGSDRFAVCLPSEMIDADKMVEDLDGLFAGMDLNYRVVVHYGFCEVPEKNFEVSDIIEQAYLACSTVKHNMVRRYAYYDNVLRESLLAEQELISHADKALKNHEFIPYFQPVFQSGTQKLVSAEALVRWKHPERGLLEPGKFVPAMERNGFIASVDACMWEAVLSFLHERMKAGKQVVPISVNMSRQDIFNPKLTDHMLSLVEKYEVDPNYLHIEVTESAYIDENLQQQLAETIFNLRKKGFIILMDDFGSGYSSLNVLKDMPVDIMKIDRGLTFDIETSERGKAMLGAIVRLANRLCIPTIAEGVETEEQYNFLKSIGCDSIQGFYFSKPVSQEEFEKLLDTSEVPEYEPGEALPGHFAHSETDFSPYRETVMLVGEENEDVFSPQAILKNEYHVKSFKDPASVDPETMEKAGYVMLTRKAYEELLSSKS
ncbi:MAG: bifunctional diguanylate cyclase/phosphodiesterase [Lachnospiraceae bacterium]|nr:bifunctional diguanylate cyclase/phosphodiesterase [Lachnospiraceae bacterium]